MLKRNTQITTLKTITLVFSCLVLGACSFSGANGDNFNDANNFKLQKYSNEITKEEFSTAIAKVEETFISHLGPEDSFEIKEYHKHSYESNYSYSSSTTKYDSKKFIIRTDSKGEEKTYNSSRKFSYSSQSQYEDGFKYDIDITNKHYNKTEMTIDYFKEEISWTAWPRFIHLGMDCPWLEGSTLTNALFYEDNNNTLYTCVISLTGGHIIYQYDTQNVTQYYEEKSSNYTDVRAYSYKKKDVNLARIDYTKYDK